MPLKLLNVFHRPEKEGDKLLKNAFEAFECVFHRPEKEGDKRIRRIANYPIMLCPHALFDEPARGCVYLCERLCVCVYMHARICARVCAIANKFV